VYVSSGALAESLATKLCKETGNQGRLMWFDAEANLWQLSTRTGVAEMVAKCKAANINTIIVDVKPLSGFVLYKSKIAPRLKSFEGRSYPRNYDLLRTVIAEGHKAGIAVHAAINVFSEGRTNPLQGPAVEHPEWQAVQYEMDRTVTIADGKPMSMACSNVPYQDGQLCLYGRDADSAEGLPPNTVFVRVGRDGIPLSCETATGFAHISAPEGGYIILANGEAGEWLKDCARRKVRFQLSGNSRLARIAECRSMHNAIFVNPCHPKVRAYELSIIEEICANYAVDGIVLDRMRYNNIYSDFSDITRAQFERYIGRPVANWPEDVFRRDVIPGDDVIRGTLFGEWLKFRAQVIKDFLIEARNVVKSTRPTAKLGVYVGSWYPVYYGVGVNWGSSKHKADYDWWPSGYEKTGYAELVDYLCTGCYYVHPTRQDAVRHKDEEWKSVEAAAQESVNAVKDATVIYGSLYLYQYNGSPKRFAEAVKQCLDKTQGCMIFDLVYVRQYGWWSLLKSLFPGSAKPPHEVPGFISKARSRR